MEWRLICLNIVLGCVKINAKLTNAIGKLEMFIVNSPVIKPSDYLVQLN